MMRWAGWSAADFDHYANFLETHGDSANMWTFCEHRRQLVERTLAEAVRCRLDEEATRQLLSARARECGECKVPEGVRG